MLSQSGWIKVQGQGKVANHVQVASHEGDIVHIGGNVPPSTPAPSSGGIIALVAGAGIVGGLIGHSAGSNSGFAKGYNQRAAEDAQLIAQYETQIQDMRRDIAYAQMEDNRLLQDNGSLRKENEILKGLLRQQPTTPQAEAILKILERVEFRLTQTLPPLFEDGGDHNTEMN